MTIEKNPFTINDHGVILNPTNCDFENQAVLNPACIMQNDIAHLFYRAVRKKDLVSSIGHCELSQFKVTHRATEPILKPEYRYEQYGIEDPRIVYLDGIYYLFYTAYDGINAQVAYAVSTDLIHFEKRGLLSAQITYGEAIRLLDTNSNFMTRFKLYQNEFKFKVHEEDLLWEKDAFIFPKKIRGQFAMLIRILPDIQVIYFRDFSELTDEIYWKQYLKKIDEHIILQPQFYFENKHIGGGCPPIETKDGWLTIYHAVQNTPSGNIYHAGAALLDLENPCHVLGRLSTPLFSPTSEFEKIGDVNNVVFPTGTLLENDLLYIYYGAADKYIAAKSLKLSDLLAALKRSPI